MRTLKIKLLAFFSLLGLFGCNDPLEEVIFSQLSPSTLFTTEEGITSTLNSAYAYAHRTGAVESWAPFWFGGMTTGESWGAGGSIESLWVQLQDFTWDSNHSQVLSMWTVYFNAIRDANIVLDNINNPTFNTSFIEKTSAEVHFIRGWAYSELYNLFGPVPLYTSPGDNPLLGRSSDAETRELIEAELTAAISDLPESAPFGRATKGAAMGVFCKYYMNTHQWQNAADMVNSIINLGIYGLQTNYADVFAVANEGNNELLWALTKSGAGGAATGQGVNALVFPPDYPLGHPNNGVFAARTYLFDDFVNSFEATDTRTDLIITEYVSTATGKVVPGLGKNQSFPYKYEWDPGAQGPWAGNDFPVIRYADVLLSRAEALNELNGPSQESIDLINQVRNRAGATPLSLAGFGTTQALRDAILDERAKEFFFEGKRREDLIRQGVFISGAVARGKKAQSHHVLFPIPQVELDANSDLEQNEGY